MLIHTLPLAMRFGLFPVQFSNAHRRIRRGHTGSFRLPLCHGRVVRGRMQRQNGRPLLYSRILLPILLGNMARVGVLAQPWKMCRCQTILAPARAVAARYLT
jgi:hypothetical protein